MGVSFIARNLQTLMLNVGTTGSDFNNMRLEGIMKRLGVIEVAIVFMPWACSIVAHLGFLREGVYDYEQ